MPTPRPPVGGSEESKQKVDQEAKTQCLACRLLHQGADDPRAKSRSTD
jgi:hypothetical protein